MKYQKIVGALGVLLLLIVPTSAGGSSELSPYSQLVLDDVEALQDKFIGLANAIPGENFSWRLDTGARSVSEVFMHVASASYFYVAHLGTPIPKGAFRGVRNLEELVAKEDVLAVLREAFNHSREHISTNGADPQATTFHMVGHLHEHLGQAIAYARSLGITPPWSVESDSQ